MTGLKKFVFAFTLWSYLLLQGAGRFSNDKCNNSDRIPEKSSTKIAGSLHWLCARIQAEVQIRSLNLANRNFPITWKNVHSCFVREQKTLLRCSFMAADVLGTYFWPNERHKSFITMPYSYYEGCRSDRKIHEISLGSTVTHTSHCGKGFILV